MTGPARPGDPAEGREERSREPLTGDVVARDVAAGQQFSDELVGRRSAAHGLADALDDAISAAEPFQAQAIRSTPASTGVMQRLRSDPETVERDLVKLVLTVVELIRQLMERQALRRVDSGSLTDEQVENVGMALMRLEEAMTKLKDHFELEDHDLNLDLGPLGTLLPED